MSVQVSSFEIKTWCGNTHDRGRAAGANRWFRSFDPDCSKCAKSSRFTSTAPPWTRRVKANWKAPAFRAYQPGEFDAGQVIVWTEGRTESDPGTERIGTIWSAGPQPNTVWVSPDDAPRSFASMNVVAIPKDGTAPWAFGQWGQPNPAAMTTIARSSYRQAA